MERLPAIQYLQHHQVDKQRWNNCIDIAGNGLIYGYAYYLDAMSTSWDALVLGDYEAVMPLPYRKKWGISYLYQPFLTAQLGIFGNNLSAALLEKFLDAIPSKFKYWDFNLNYGNLFPLHNYNLRQRTNYVLDLNKPYPEIAAQYRENTKRNIKRSYPFKVQVRKGIPVSEVIELNRQQSIHQNQALSNDDYNRFKSLYALLEPQDKAMTYGVYTERNELLASVAFLYSYQRAYYLLVGNHPNSRALGASHRLIDSFIQDHAGKPLILDFEGSDIASLAFFYRSFGAHQENYSSIVLNRLPWPIKWLKK